MKLKWQIDHLGRNSSGVHTSDIRWNSLYQKMVFSRSGRVMMEALCDNLIQLQEFRGSERLVTQMEDILGENSNAAGRFTGTKLCKMVWNTKLAEQDEAK
ncbi:hypothetical protein AVEN_95488-1 [Araneus ventricosus]|uniref:Uncharacterized protein n=1 Tax=Araneus ventricosus TaxID=182803 RepID=A0A4Y2WTY3_ARAVE|nr:hypothetical protein AVEN_95488-1 [Araneus ventricosus]